MTTKSFYHIKSDVFPIKDSADHFQKVYHQNRKCISCEDDPVLRIPVDTDSLREKFLTNRFIKLLHKSSVRLCIIGLAGLGINGAPSHVAAEGFPSIIEFSSLEDGDGSQGFMIQGVRTDDLSGSSVSSAGDVNDDGMDDFIIGSVRAGADFAGEVYVIFGRGLCDENFPSEFDLTTLATGDGSTGFILNGSNLGDLSGVSVSQAGDVNGDGVDDLIIIFVGLGRYDQYRIGGLRHRLQNKRRWAHHG